jgi:cytidine deaminase
MPDLAELVDSARRAAEGSYSPYSGFRVGAAVVTEDGTVVSSANVENGAYPVSQCAEANAVNYAVSQGHRLLPTVAVACIDAETVDDAYPCGRCRQIMSEFGVETIHVTTGSGEVRTHTLDELLPHRFSL